MKTLLLVVSILLLLLGMGAYAMVGMVDSKDAQDVEDVTALLGEEAVAAAGDEVPSAGRIQGGMILAFVAIIVLLAVIIITFAKPASLKTLLIIVATLAILTILVHPSIDKGEYGGKSGQFISIIAAVLAIGGTAAAFFAKKPKTA